MRVIFLVVATKNQFHHLRCNKILIENFLEIYSPQRHEPCDVRMPMKTTNAI